MVFKFFRYNFSDNVYQRFIIICFIWCFSAFWIDSWLDRKDIGVVVVSDLVDNCLELAFIDFINNVTNKTIKYVNINV